MGWGGNKMRDLDTATGKLLPCMKIQLAYSSSFLKVMNTNKTKSWTACLPRPQWSNPRLKR